MGETAAGATVTQWRMLEAKVVKGLCRLTDDVPIMALPRVIDDVDGVGNGAETWPF